MSSNNLAIGRIGEELARIFLQKRGFTILRSNFRFGPTEIDLIAQRGNTIHFIEVKTRRDQSKGKPYEAVNAKKRRNILRTAEYFLLQSKMKRHKLSLDVVSIMLDYEGVVRAFDYFENIIL